jgi:pyridoxal phosphate enzyme (YggS family)
MEAAKRLAIVRREIDEAAKAARRPHEEVALVAVSKTFPAEDVGAFLGAGQKDFGESYVQEAREKIPKVADGAVWHFIGHLQANKAKHAAPLFSTLHSLESLSLAAELERRLADLGRTMKVYIEVNVAGEDQKSGLAPAELPAFLDNIAKYQALAPIGLMTMPPYDPDPEASRPHFAALRELRDKVCPALKGLSMGMSGDFQVAISEGATVVRVGTALFGRRS